MSSLADYKVHDWLDVAAGVATLLILATTLYLIWTGDWRYVASALVANITLKALSAGFKATGQ